MNEKNSSQSRGLIQSHKNIWFIIILTALITGGAVYVWQDLKIKSIQKYFQQQITELENLTNQIQQNEISTKRDEEQTYSGLTEAEVLKLKFSLDILRSEGVRRVFQYPENPNIFVYINKDNEEEKIWKFDTSKNENYLQEEYLIISDYKELLLNTEIPDENEFRGVGFDGSKFIFTETKDYNSPGPCFSPWFYDNLSYVYINDLKIIREPYKVSDQKLQEEKIEQDNCLKNL